MKRTVALLLVIVMFFSLTACGNEPKDEDKEIKQKTEKDKNNEESPKKEDEVVDKTDKKVIDPSELLKNVHARRAIAMGFDKTFITDFIEADGSKPVDYLIPLGLAFDDNGEDFRKKYPEGFLHYNPEEAKKEWETAKKELSFDKAELEFLTFDSENAKRIAEYINEQLSANLEGLSIKINQQPLKQKIELSQKGQYQLELSGWGPDYPDATTLLDLFWSGSGQNSGDYYNKEFEDIISSVKSGDLATHTNERWEALQEAEKLLLEDAPVIPLYQDGTTGIQRPYLKGVLKHAFGAGYTYKSASTEIETDGKKIIRLLGGADIPGLDHNKATDQVSFEILGNVMEGLVTLGENDTVLPGIAKDWAVSEDSKEYIFNLRETTWSNGEPITAQDFVDSWRRLIDPANKAQYQYIVESAGILNASEIIKGELQPSDLGVEALGDYTLKVKLSQAVPYFVKMMSFPAFYPIKKSFVEKAGDKFGKSVDTVLYNGPYKLEQWDPNYGYSFRKNEKYWDINNVKNDGVDYRVVKDYNSAIALYDNGEIDKCVLLGEYVEQRKDSPDFKTDLGTSMYYIIINVGNSKER